MSWDFHPATEKSEEWRKDWDTLNQSRHNHVLLDSAFIAPLVKHFGGGQVWVARSASSQRPGMVLLTRNGKMGWETFQPAQAPIGLIVLGQRDETGGCLRQLLRELPGYCVQLGIRQQDPACSDFPPLTGYSDMELVEYIRTARLSLAGTFEEYWQSRGRNLRHNMARRRRRLTEQGYTLELLAHRTPEKVAECIGEYGRLETQGWKAEGGTAVAKDNAQGRYYREIFEAFCARGEAVIYQLLLNGKIAASDLCLQRAGMLVVLKTTYDEQLEDFSPGFLMREEIMKRLHAENQVRVVEFYGRLREWHTRWTDDIRQMYHLNCYRHNWVPGIKRLLKKLA